MTYRQLPIWTKINLKGLISGDRASREMYGRIENFDELLKLTYLLYLTSDWETAINMFLYKMDI